MPLDVAAEKLGISADRLRAYEDPASNLRPTIKQLRDFAKLYRKPTAFFYLVELPEKPPVPHDYRLVPGVTGRPTHEALDAVLEARQRRLDAIELSELLAERIPDFRVRVAGDRPAAQVLGQQIRAALGVTIEEQRNWRGDYYRALRGWSDAAEQAGVLVFQFSRVDTGHGLGFSLPERPLPLVSLNGGDQWPQRKIFTLMHELAHIALDAPGVCSPGRVPTERQDGDARTEKYCNGVAAEILMPRAVFLTEPSIQRAGRDHDWTDQELDELRRAYAVSYESILLRLVDLRRASFEFYRHWKRTHPLPESGGGFLSWPIRYVRDNGRRFTSLVMDAYASELVTSPEASRLLGSIKLEHFPAMRARLS
jgi:Zn-dependent peptidase ImmA (M78 family)